MNNLNLIQSRLDALSKQPFRARFHLKGKEKQIFLEKGTGTIFQHAVDLLSKRLAPAFPKNDGKQTPYKGHPVFVAQHATATCCRSCLMKWHKIPKGKEMSQEEIEYAATVIKDWLLRELSPDGV